MILSWISGRQLAVAGGICITGLLQIIFDKEYRHTGIYWLLLPCLIWLAAFGGSPGN